MGPFEYNKAFGRNLGYISAQEQEKLRTSHVVILGLGGTGGSQAQTLVRLGIGRFTIADPDTFELSNFNRQAGANMDTLGRKKCDVIAEMIRSINPEASIRTFDKGLNAQNIDEILDGANVVVDSLDLYCFEERFLLYSTAHKKNIWVITSPPLGFGCSTLVFDPRGMRFQDYFDFNPDMSRETLTKHFMYGLCPSPMIVNYFDRRQFNPGLPSPCVSPGFALVAGMSVTDAVNILLKKQPILAAPWICQFDALLHVFKKKYYFFGMQSWWQRLKRKIIFAFVGRGSQSAAAIPLVESSCR